CPHAVFFPVLDCVSRAQSLLCQWAAPQAQQPRLGGRLLISACLGGTVTAVVIGVAEPQFRVDRTWMPHQYVSFCPKTYAEAYTQVLALGKRNVMKTYIPG